MATENPRVWFKSISLENVRSFGTKQTINFTDKDGNAARWNIILGDNGTGKTTVLKGLFLTDWSIKVYGKVNHSIFNSHSLLRGFDNEAKIGIVYDTSQYFNSTIGIKLSGNVYEKALTEIWGTGNELYSHMQSIMKFRTSIHGYGANRFVNEMSIKQTGTLAQSLFDEKSSLIAAETWLMDADYVALKKPELVKYYNSVKTILLKLFKNEIYDFETKVDFHTPVIYCKTNYGEVRMRELSLGYKTLIAWMVDFAKGLLDRYPDSKDPLSEPAVCLVDEIDLHLHPKFQRTIIKFLTDTFPNTQFIVTAHSPLIVQSAEDANIILLKREGNETHVAEGIDVHSWRIDQILSSDLFGEVSVRPPETEAKMQRRRALLLQDERTYEENQELEQLEEELGMLTSSESEEALKALELIGKSLSR